MFAIGYDVVALIVLSAAMWLWVTKRSLPNAKAELLDSEVYTSASSYVKYSVLRLLAFVCGACAVALAFVLLIAAAMNFYAMAGGEGLASVERVVSARSIIETTLGWAQFLSGTLWIVIVIALALGWFFFTRSASRKNWLAAISARQDALKAQSASLSREELQNALETADPDAAEALSAQISYTTSTNQTLVDQALNEPRVQLFQDRPDKFSIVQLADHVRHLDQQAANAEGDDREALLQQANAFDQIVSHEVQNAQVEFTTLTGALSAPLRSGLNGAAEGIGVDEDAQREWLLDRYVEARMRDHTALADQVQGKEPELWHEWLRSGLTSEAAVQSSVWTGQKALRVAFGTILLGFIGFGASSQASTFIAAAQSQELELTLQLNNEAIEAAALAQSEAAEADSTELASDEDTANQLREAMEGDIAQALLEGYGRNAGRPDVGARNNFALRSQGARGRLLQLSARSAAPSLETTGVDRVYSTTPEGSAPELSSRSSVTDARAVMDETIDRRINQLRSNENVWSRLRSAAARRPSVELLANSFFDATLPGSPMAKDPAFRLMVERVATRTATQSLNAGSIGGRNVNSPFSGGDVLSARDRRLITDFGERVPVQVESHIDNLKSGRIDPGSLHRRIPASAGSIGSSEARLARAAASYGDIFPTAAQAGLEAGSAFSGGGGRGSGASSRSSSSTRPARAASRSYGRIRFSGRVGGVVIGREANDNEALDVRAFEWTKSGDQIEISLTVEGGAPVRIGRFHPAIVSAALSYAADGRVVTSTLPGDTLGQDGGGLPARQVVVHPSFEDTPFACRAIQIDRFVDSYMYAQTPTAYELQLARSGVTMAGSLIAGDRSEDDQQFSNAASIVGLHARSCGTGKECFPFEDYSAAGIDLGYGQAVRSCLANGADTDECKRVFESQSPSARIYVDSGVREASYTLDTDFDFLTGRNERDPLWPLQFIVQAVPQSDDELDMAAFDGSDPWEFPSIKKKLQSYIASNVAFDGRARSTWRDMRDFVVLQRTFRLALAGSLGDQFPIEEMVLLGQATAHSVRVERHEHWNVNSALQGIIGSEVVDMVDSLKALAAETPEGMPCNTLAKEQLSQWQRRQDFTILKRMGEIPQVCSGRTQARQIKERMDALRSYDLVNEALHLEATIGQSRGLSCGPL